MRFSLTDSQGCLNPRRTFAAELVLLAAELNRSSVQRTSDSPRNPLRGPERHRLSAVPPCSKFAQTAYCLSSGIPEHHRPPVPGSGNPPRNDDVWGLMGEDENHRHRGMSPERTVSGYEGDNVVIFPTSSPTSCPRSHSRATSR